MTKKLMCMALASLVGATALNAQENTSVPARKAHFAKDGAKSHWFLEIGDAASYQFSGMNYYDFDRKGGVNFVNPSLAIGRWHNPYFATRARATYGNFTDRFHLEGDTKTGYQATHKYAMGQVDFMFDVVNYFSAYKENRFFHVIPFLSVGASMQVDTDFPKNFHGPLCAEGKYSDLAGGGLQLKFRLAKRVDLNLEAQVLAKNFRTTSELSPVAYDAEDKSATYRRSFLGTAGASLTFHLGKKEFTQLKAQDNDLIASLNKQLNSLRAENAELSKRPVDCPEAPAPQVAGIAVGNVVYFRLNSAVVDPNQLINIRNIAEYAKNNTETITLVGYADRQTGTPDYNYKLSERRAEAVKKILVEKYGISADRIKTSWEGDRQQPYAENVWNRIVIMNAE